MKTTFTRRHRRHASSTEAKMFKKDNQQELAFFAPPSHESFFKPTPAINRKCDHCEAEEKNVQKMTDEKHGDKNIKRQAEHKEEEKTVQKTEEKVQREPEKKEEEKPVNRLTDKKEEDKTVAKKENNNTNTGGVAATGAYIKSLDGKGSSLPKETLHFFSKKMNYDFSNVKIHTGTEAEQSAKNINAKAYAADNNLVFNKAQYNPVSAEGQKLLAHELTHVMQQGNEKEILNRIAADTSQLNSNTNASFQGSYARNNKQNQRDYGCEGINLQGHTDANYADSFDPTVNIKPSATCKNCEPKDCFTASGMIVSKFTASPVVTLPRVPDGLADCETKAVSKFINTTLNNHEQQHVTAFNTYNGVKKTPYHFNGCSAEFDSYMQSQQDAHNALNTQKIAKANALSAALDPFNPVIPCDC